MEKRLAVVNCNRENSCTGLIAAQKAGVDSKVINFRMESMKALELCKQIKQFEATHVLFDNIPLESGRIFPIPKMGKYIWEVLCHNIRVGCYLGERQDGPFVWQGDWRDWSLVTIFPFETGNEAALYAGWIAEDVCPPEDLASTLRLRAIKLGSFSQESRNCSMITNRLLDLAIALESLS